MDLDLQFRLLKTPPSTKVLMAFRKDADSEGLMPPPKPADPRGKLQWIAIELKNKQIGIARLELAAPEFCFVSELMIASQYRGLGIGHWVMTRIEQYCLSLGIKRLLLEAGEGTDNFYKSQAFISDPLMPRLLRKDINPFQRKMFAPLFH
ncbi:GNAT family N-acetyltransferase [Duganella sp. sic0402]|uniref:GNAT family N-acetyltransferase n=1 Tax=Duganella sp. sic0402 TaxID=2854786 RepID=UPI001C44F9C8|nr:GNAT family N-acetyltransferase [Duganella sp. sic0402]MBV7536740.1 GNAT family N-acetyltransferase [Duganella sp. sic0402]